MYIYICTAGLESGPPESFLGWSLRLIPYWQYMDPLGNMQLQRIIKDLICTMVLSVLMVEARKLEHH